MFERYTDRARKAVVLAQEEARMMGSSEITPGHLLLGLATEEGGVASIALAKLGLNPDEARRVLRKLSGTSTPMPGHIPFGRTLKQATDDALREAIAMGNNYIATEHLLLGLLRPAEGQAHGILISAGIAPPVARDEVLRLLAGYEKPRVERKAHPLAADRLTAELDAIEQHQETGSLFDFATGDSPRLLKALRDLLSAADDWTTKQRGDSPLVGAAGHQVREIMTRALLGDDHEISADEAEAERIRERRALAEDVAVLHQEFVEKLRAAAPTSAYARKLLLSIDPDGGVS